jgi:hypothetical protein
VHITENTWGKKIKTTCRDVLDKQLVEIRVDNPHYAPDGFTTNTFHVSKDEDTGRDVLRWKRRIYPSVDSDEPALDDNGNEVGSDLYCMLDEEAESTIRRVTSDEGRGGHK